MDSRPRSRARNAALVRYAAMLQRQRSAASLWAGARSACSVDRRGSEQQYGKKRAANHPTHRDAGERAGSEASRSFKPK